MIDMRKKIGIIGYGNMGSAIAHKLALQTSEFSVSVSDKDKSKLVKYAGIDFAKDIKELLGKSDIILLAVKPQDFGHVLREIKSLAAGKLIISIAAGISTKHIEKTIPRARVIRVMPNIGAKISESVSCLCKGAFSTDEDLGLAQELFSFLGVVLSIDENMMDAATAISGSGPAYVFYFIENSELDQQNLPEHARRDMMRRLEKAAEELGFSNEDAAFLAANTVNSSVNLLYKTKISAEELRKQVTSKGGTTEAALEILFKGGSWDEAAQAAMMRAKELSGRI